MIEIETIPRSGKCFFRIRHHPPMLPIRWKAATILAPDTQRVGRFCFSNMPFSSWSEIFSNELE